MDSLARLSDWPVGSAAAVVVDRDGTALGSFGTSGAPYHLASVTKLLTGYAVLLAVEEGGVALDEPAGPAGATVEHLLSHASGLGPGRAAGDRRPRHPADLLERWIRAPRTVRRRRDRHRVRRLPD